MRFLGVVFSSILLAGCSLSTERDATAVPNNTDADLLTDDFVRSRLIAADLSGAIRQLPELDPARTVVHTARPPSHFGQLLLGTMQGAGYDLRIAQVKTGHWLSYEVQRDRAEPATTEPVFTFVVSIGQIKLKRSYAVSTGRVRPVTTLYLLGADASNVVLDDALFDPSRQTELPRPSERSEPLNGALISAVPVKQPLKATRLPLAATDSSALAPEVASAHTTANAPELISAITRVTASAIAATPASAPARRPIDERPNMYDSRKSFFEDALTGYQTVNKEILVFANDSLYLGKQNKRTVHQMLDAFNPATDVVSVIGCSHGKSALADGNRVLALGRAKRVRDELLHAGIGVDQVFDEGCWAPVHFDEVMPRRGVVLMHKRKFG